MKALAMLPAPQQTKARTPQVLAQRKGGSATTPALGQSGQTLDPLLRARMESGFGQDFSAVRVHDDARAHDAARDLGARAYAAGNSLVFGEGAYRPETPAGQALIAHELAHTVQQGGVQMQADPSLAVPLPASTDAALESEADHAAFAFGQGRPVPALSRIGRPAIQRNTTTTTAPGGLAPGSVPETATVPSTNQKLPPGLDIIKDDPPGSGTTELIVAVPQFTLPQEKGLGAWVQKAYDDAGAGGRLVFSPLIEGGKVAAYKEGSEDYKSIWLGTHGFDSTQGLATAFTKAALTNEAVKTAMADKDVKALVTGMATSLKQSGCDIDHIVEKQMGGTSIPSNLQLLNSSKNQASGRETYQELVKIVEAIRETGMRGKNVKRLQLQIRKATVPPATSDASFIVEDLLRKGAVKGSDVVKAKAEGKPVRLLAGGQGEVVDIKDTGTTLIDSMAKRIVPGARLVKYSRGKGAVDSIEAELDSRAIDKSGEKSGVLPLVAEKAPDTAAAPGTVAGAAPAPVAAVPGEPSTPTATGEVRLLKIDPSKKTKTNIKFYYPYLSPGELTSVALDDKGNLTGEGNIHSSVPFLGTLKIRYSPDHLELVAPIPAKDLKPPIPQFRFTGGELALQLSPSLVPKGNLTFEVGPASKPVMLGELSLSLVNGAVEAKGKLTPGTKLPGISSAEGTVIYNSDSGWSGSLKASSSSIPNSTIDAELGFTSDKGGFRPYGKGGIKTTLKDSTLALNASWQGGAVGFAGSVIVPKPLPMVESVRLEGSYGENGLALTGTAPIKWKNIDATITVNYRRKDGEEGKFSGSATVVIKTEKATGSISLNFNEKGDFWGKGTIAYQVTKDIRPELGVELTADRRVKVTGEVAIGTIALTRMWPAPNGGTVSIVKGIGVKFDIPTPVPGITAYGEIRGSLGLGYGVGPVMLKSVVFKGELYPLEDDPKVSAKLTGKFAVPAYAELYGTFGAYIGLEVLLGAVGAKGGIEVTSIARSARWKRRWRSTPAISAIRWRCCGASAGARSRPWPARSWPRGCSGCRWCSTATSPPRRRPCSMRSTRPRSTIASPATSRRRAPMPRFWSGLASCRSWRSACGSGRAPARRWRWGC